MRVESANPFVLGVRELDQKVHLQQAEQRHVAGGRKFGGFVQCGVCVCVCALKSGVFSE